MHPFVLLSYSVWIIAVTTFLSMRRSDAVDHECQGRIFGSIAGPSRNAMTSRRSRGTSCEGYSADGYLQVFNGHEYYRFDPKEIFLFMLTKCRIGKSNRELCDLVFGGNSSRWSFGYPWILVYLDMRYARTISHEKLRDFVDEFRAFYDAINRFIQKPTVHHFTDGSAEECDGLNFLPFSIFGFIDCSIDRISRPFSGPDGDYIGAPRKAMHHAAQRSVYTGYKKCHGIKVETVLLPNGISTVYGPTSARIHDVGGVLQMSGLDNFLMLIQQGRPDVYSAFGDSAYNAQYLQCIR
jgi:hypothetical protein